MPMSKETTGEKLATMAEQIKNIDRTATNIEAKLDKNYVTIDKHALVQDKVDRLEKIIYGVIMLLIAGLITAAFAFFRK